MASINLTKRRIESEKAPPKATKTVLHDAKVTGLALVVHPTGKKVWSLYYRTASGQQRRPKLGDYGVLTVEQARRLAKEQLAQVAAGEDPSKARREARGAPTMVELWDRYWKEHALPHKKPASRRKDETNWRLHIRDRLGTKKVSEVSRQDIRDLKAQVAKRGQGVANRCLSLLSKMFNFAERDLEILPPGSNPAKGVRKFPEAERERYLRPSEYGRLSAVLQRASTEEFQKENRAVSSVALDVIRFILATGTRVGTALALQWDHVQVEQPAVMHVDTKNGRKHIALNPVAASIIEAQEPWPSNPYVFASPAPRRVVAANRGWRRQHLSASRLERAWTVVRREAELDDVRLHDLRHSFAAMAVGQGYSLRTIGHLLGNTSAPAIKRYAHVPDDYAAQVSSEIGAALEALMKVSHDRQP